MDDRTFLEKSAALREAVRSWSYREDRAGFDGERCVRASMDAWKREPRVELMARVLEDVLATMPVRVKPHDLLVGQKGGPGCHCLEAEALAQGSAEFPYFIPDYATLLERGTDGLLDEVEARLVRLDEADPAQMERVWFLRACGRVLGAMAALAGRYAGEADRQAAACADPARKAELEGIAARCRRVPAKPARGFAEAIQSLWFLYVVLQTESSSACCVGTLDRTLLPYYEADLAAGRIDPNEARLWICHLFAKAYEKNYGDPNDQVQNCTLGGVKADGTSAVNELSWLILDAARAMGNVGLQVSIRWSRAVEPAFVRAALGLMRDGRFMPQLFNDDLYVPGIEAYGVAHGDAVRYALFGCHEPVIAGMSHMRPASYPGYLSAYDWVEKALGLASRRRPSLHLERVGPPPESRAEFERRIFEAMREAVRAAVIDMNRGDRVKAALMPRPAMSLFMRDCLERETEITAGGARYNMTGFQVCGLANAVDAALAVGTLVFGRGEIPMEEYLAAMVDGFAGREDLRLRILRTAPKYGADSDEADALAARLAEAFIEETKKYRNARGGPFTPGFWSFVSAISIGSRTAAGADGRPAGKPIAHDLDPHPGRATKGATAVANAMTRLPQDRMVNGACALIELDSGCFRDDESFEKVYRYFTTYMESGGLNVQMSHVSAEKLEAAQKDPEAYADLVVRVSGYSEFFTRCSPELQEYIVSREKHKL